MGTCVDSPPSALVELIYIPDIWEMVCNLLDGDAISVLVRVPPFSAPTQGSPAFIFLAGINDNASIVPWNDVSNVLSSKYDRSHRLNWHREVAAEQTVECFCVCYNLLFILITYSVIVENFRTKPMLNRTFTAEVVLPDRHRLIPLLLLITTHTQIH